MNDSTESQIAVKGTAAAWAPLLAVFVALSIGVSVSHCWVCDALVVFVVALAGSILAMSTFMWQHRARYLVTSILFAVAATGFVRHYCYGYVYPANHIISYLTKHPRPAVLEATISSLPELSTLDRPDPLATVPHGVESKCRLSLKRLRVGDRWQTVSGKADLWVNGHLVGLQAGDRVRVFGQISLLPLPMNPGQRSYVPMGRAERLLCKISVGHPECVRAIDRAVFSPARWIGWIRYAGLQCLDRAVGPEQGRLAGALLLGARDRLTSEEMEQFFRTGTIHLLAISGLHVGLLAGGFFWAARSGLVSKRTILVLLIVLSAFYCLITGMRAPVLRASLLIHLISMQWILNRSTSAVNALSTAAIGVLMLRPGDLFLPGAQLSFLAVGTLIWFSRQRFFEDPTPLQMLIRRSRPWYRRLLDWIAQKATMLFLASLAVWLVTLPLVAMNFHLVSTIGIVLNVLFAIPIAAALSSGMLVLCCHAIFPGLASWGGAFCSLNLRCVQATNALANELPRTPVASAYFWTAGPDLFWCWVFYICLLAFIACPPKWKPPKWVAIVLLVGWWLVPPARLVPRLWPPAETNSLRCTFLAVGHGNCVVLEMPDGRTVIYDAGRVGLPDVGVDIVSQFLWHRRIGCVDAIVISHADADHYNAVPGLLERFSVGEIWVVQGTLQQNSQAVQCVHEAIMQQGIPIRNVQSGDSFEFGKATVEVLHPEMGITYSTDNANSIVLDVRCGSKRLLLPGDLELDGLERFLQQAPQDYDVLLTPHHGSVRSRPDDIVGWSSPEFVVISDSYDRQRSPRQRDAYRQALAKRFGEPSAANRLFDTSDGGAVTVTVGVKESTPLTIQSFLGR